jgi:hypothetical protein
MAKTFPHLTAPYRQALSLSDESGCHHTGRLVDYVSNFEYGYGVGTSFFFQGIVLRGIVRPIGKVGFIMNQFHYKVVSILHIVLSEWCR